MTPKRLIAFAVVLTLAFCGSVLAGPKFCGDPDIFEGIRSRDRTPVEHMSGDASPGLIVINVPIYHRSIQIWRENVQRRNPVPRRITAVTSKTRVRP
jgi:hypothetical protein